MKKEREEVCRQWQQLRDEITRMEEMHEIQKVSKRQQVCRPVHSSGNISHKSFTLSKPDQYISTKRPSLLLYGFTLDMLSLFGSK